MPRRSRAQGRTAWALPAAGSVVDRGVIRLAALIVRSKGKNRSHASRLGACGRRGSCRKRSEANRGIGVGARRPGFGSARGRRAPLGGRRGARRNRAHSELNRVAPVRQRILLGGEAAPKKGARFSAWKARTNKSGDGGRPLAKRDLSAARLPPRQTKS